MATMGLSTAMAHDISMLLSDDNTRHQLKGFISVLKRQKKQADKAAKLRFKEELKADLTEALQELKDAKEGKTAFMTMDELYNDLAKEGLL